MPELLEAIAEAHAGEPVDIYEHLQPQVIDNATGAVWEFIETVKQVKK